MGPGADYAAVMATLIIVLAGVVVVLIAGLVLLVVFVSTRPRTKPGFRLPGFSRFTSGDAEDRTPPSH